MSLKTVRNYINGKWVEAETTNYLDVENPTTGQVIARTPLSTAAETNRAIEAAAEAFAEWSRTPVSRRIQPIYKLVEMVRENEEKLAHSVTEEMGKSLPDSRAEIKRLVENCEVACSMPVLQQGDKLIGCSYGIGIPAPVAYLPFGGMKASEFADIKAQGKTIINFFTEDKIVTERYWPENS